MTEAVVENHKPATPELDRRSSYERLKDYWRNPSWWVREIVVATVVALIVGGLTMWGQARIDDDRAERDHQIAANAAVNAERAENLRFVRERSTDDPNSPRPFQYLDLRGQALNGLQLSNADFLGADLSDSHLVGTDLSGANLVGTDLSGTFLYAANFRDAAFSRVDLRGADLRDVHGLIDTDHYDELEGYQVKSIVQDVCWNEWTEWPEGYEPPPSDESICEIFDR